MSSPKHTILILGMPASGKTTCGELLATQLGIPHRSVGDQLRAGRESRPTVSTIDDPATTYLEAELQRTPDKFVQGLIVDFSPVHADGIGNMTKALGSLGFQIDVVVYIRSTIAESRAGFLKRGSRAGDPDIDMDAFFHNRIRSEFWPFTLPLVRKAHLHRRLIVLRARGSEHELMTGVAQIASVLATLKTLDRPVQNWL